MKCPICGAETSVLATRDTNRRRVCFNEHRFSTVEVHKPDLDQLRADVMRLARLLQQVDQAVKA